MLYTERVEYVYQGGSLLLRRVVADDAAMLESLLHSLSARTCRLRFLMSHRFSPELARREVARMLRGQAGDHLTLVAYLCHDAGDELVAVAELVRDPYEADTAEVAMVVRDDHQGQGIGTILSRELMRVAVAEGITNGRIDMRTDNRGVRGLLRRLNLSYVEITHREEVQLMLRMPVARSRLLQRVAAALGLARSAAR